MGTKTIPQLQIGTVIDANSLLVFDSGTQTYQITAPLLAQGLRPLATPPAIADKIANYSPTVTQEGGTIGLNSSAGSFNVQLPAPNTMTGKFFNLSDVAGSLAAFPVTLVRAAAELIEGLASDYLLQSDWGNWRIFSNGTNWIVTRGFSRKTFTGPGSFVVPAGTKKIKAIATKLAKNPLSWSSTGLTASVVDVEGNVWAWGINTNGQLGTGAVPPLVTSIPTAVINNMSFRRMKQAIQLGGVQVLLDDAGHLFSVGVNTAGYLGDGTVITKSSPVAVVGGMTFKRIWTETNNGGYVMVQAYNGLTYTWGGQSTSGELGVGDIVAHSSPIAVLGSHVFAQVDNRCGVFVLGLDEAGQAWAWGNNSTGNLGVGDVLSRSSPVAVLGTHVFKKLYTRRALSSQQTCYGLDTDGKLWAWGTNDSGQLGDGTVIDKSSPVAVLGNHVFSDFFVGQDQGIFVFAVDTAGQLWGWGINDFGQLGDGTATNARSSPVAVLGTHKFVKCYHTTQSTFAIDDAGAAWFWGRQISGQGGNGTVLPSSSPVAVLGGHVFEHMAIEGASAVGVIAIDSDGTLWAWGVNASGQLGLGDVTPRSSPVAVTGPLGFGPTAKLQPEVTEVEIITTPGATLAVAIHGNYVKVGRAFVGTGNADYVTLEW